MEQRYRIELPELHPEQARIKAEAARFNVAECGRRFGKTVLGEELLDEPALQGKPVGWFAPTYKMLAEPWRDTKNTLASVIRHANEQEKRLELITGGVLDFWSLEDGANSVRGRKYARVVIDEAGRARNLQEAWQEAIRPTLTDLIGDAFFLSTPRGRNFFHQLFARAEGGEKDWRAWRFGSIRNPFLPAGEIDAAKRELPEQVFRQEYEGVPADDAGNPFGISAIADCVGPVSTKPARVFGADLAKSVDWTWLIGIDEGNCVSLSERWQSDWQQTRSRITRIVSTHPCLIDSTGVGDPIVEELQRTPGARFEGYKFSAQSKQQLMEGLAAAIQQRLIRFPDGPLRSELECFGYEYTKTGVRYSAPEGMHDDGVCALALALAAAHQFRTPRVVAELI